MEIVWKLVIAFLTFIATIAIEAYIGVSLDKIYWLNLIVQSFSDAFIPLMPTTGPFAQSTENIKLLIAIFFLSIDLFAALGVYKLIPDTR